MFKQSYNIIGVMSGTSLDGVDVAHLYFKIINGKWHYEILECETVSYSEDWLYNLKAAVTFSETKLQQLNEAYTLLLGTVIKTFIEKNSIKNLDAVCSHGHTILHQPQNGLTLQIGNLPKIAEIIKQTVVCDFRVQDVQLGGQGAPLVPVGDQLLFADYDYCLNLGGFSNVSFEHNNTRFAFDIAPVNTVLNFYASQLGLDYDDKGKISRSGKLHAELFDALNALDYYKKAYPKSLGFEFVKETILPLIEKYPLATIDKMHTFIVHSAFQTSLALNYLDTSNRKILITGGGAYNDFLIERIQFYLPQLAIIIPDAKTLEYKEALIFGLLGVLKLRNENNVLCSVTGAKHDHSAGRIYEA